MAGKLVLSKQMAELARKYYPGLDFIESEYIETETLSEITRRTKMEKKTVAHFPSYKLGTFKKGYKEQGRNDICACGSGKKYKHCCLGKLEAPLRAKVVEASKTTEKEAGK